MPRSRPDAAENETGKPEKSDIRAWHPSQIETRFKSAMSLHSMDRIGLSWWGSVGKCSGNKSLRKMSIFYIL